MSSYHCCCMTRNPICYSAGIKAFHELSAQKKNLVTDITRISVATENYGNSLTSHGPLTQAHRNSLLNEQRAPLCREKPVFSYEFLIPQSVRVSCFPHACYMPILKYCQQCTRRYRLYDVRFPWL